MNLACNRSPGGLATCGLSIRMVAGFVESSERKEFLLWRFPFTIIYSDQQSVITIWAVAHGSRRPDYWTGRL